MDDENESSLYYPKHECNTQDYEIMKVSPPPDLSSCASPILITVSFAG